MQRACVLATGVPGSVDICTAVARTTVELYADCHGNGRGMHKLPRKRCKNMWVAKAATRYVLSFERLVQSQVSSLGVETQVSLPMTKYGDDEVLWRRGTFQMKGGLLE